MGNIMTFQHKKIASLLLMLIGLVCFGFGLWLFVQDIVDYYAFLSLNNITSVDVNKDSYRDFLFDGVGLGAFGFFLILIGSGWRLFWSYISRRVHIFTAPGQTSQTNQHLQGCLSSLTPLVSIPFVLALVGMCAWFGVWCAPFLSLEPAFGYIAGLLILFFAAMTFLHYIYQLRSRTIVRTTLLDSISEEVDGVKYVREQKMRIYFNTGETKDIKIKNKPFMPWSVEQDGYIAYHPNQLLNMWPLTFTRLCCFPLWFIWWSLLILLETMLVTLI